MCYWRGKRGEGGRKVKGSKRRELKNAFLLGKRRISEGCPCPETVCPNVMLVGTALLPSFSMEKAKTLMLV